MCSGSLFTGSLSRGFRSNGRAPVNGAETCGDAWVNYCNSGSGSTARTQSGRHGLRLALLLTAALALPVPALAQLAVVASGATQYEYNSNVYDLTRGQPLPPGDSGHGFGDSSFTESGKLDSSYLIDGQQFFATVAGSDSQYDRFTNLDHDEYSLDGTWDWKAASIWDGVLDVTRIRSMVSFFNLIGDQLVLQTEQRETAKGGLQFTPDWRVEVTGLTHKVDQPQPDAPNLSLSESSGQAAFKYVGTAGLTSGVTATYLSGKFDGTGTLFNGTDVFLEAPSYIQRSEGLTVTDEVSGLSTLRADIGYTKRSSATGTDNASGVTGQFDYKRALTGKTSVDLNLSRQINVYLTNTGTEIDSIASLTVNWQATYKIGVALNYTYTYRQLPNQGDAPLGSERVDELNFAQLQVTYQPFMWLILKPYVEYQDRSARHYLDGNFNDNIAGILFTVQWENGMLAQRTPLN
jgi:hypothetical protein